MKGLDWMRNSRLQCTVLLAFLAHPPTQKVFLLQFCCLFLLFRVILSSLLLLFMFSFDSFTWIDCVLWALYTTEQCFRLKFLQKKQPDVHAIDISVRNQSYYLSNHVSASYSYKSNNNQGQVVPSVVSLTSSFRVISLTVLADSIYNILIFLAEKMWIAFALQKLLTFFQQKKSAYLRITRCKF